MRSGTSDWTQRRGPPCDLPEIGSGPGRAARLRVQAEPLVYVDGGSSDGSVALARALGATVVELDSSLPFTAARARNRGFESILATAPDTKLVQFLDGDCELRTGWIAAASTRSFRSVSVPTVERSFGWPRR